MAVTRWPCALRIVPREEEMIPLPIPLITPPVTSTYFILLVAHVVAELELAKCNIAVIELSMGRYCVCRS